MKSKIKSLPQELVSLVQHIELNKTGWWERSLQRLIVAVIWQSTKQLNTDFAVKNELRKMLGVDISLGDVSNQLRILLEEKTLIKLPNGQFKITDQQLNQFEENLQETKNIQSHVQECFIRIIEPECETEDEADLIWKNFNDKFLIPLVHEFGVATYGLISGIDIEIETSLTFVEFLQQYPPNLRPTLRVAVLRILDPEDRSSRAYIIRYLNAFFFIESANLSGKALKKITETMKTKPEFNIFFDTNFLFSILSLHDNPSNEAAFSLLKLIQEISNQVAIDLFVSPLTFEEVKYVLKISKQVLDGYSLIPNVAEAIIQSDSVTGIKRKYVEELAAKKTLTPEIYFSPYLSGLISILDDKEISVFDENMETYKTNLEVQSEIDKEVSYQQKWYATNPRNRISIEHDIVLWHFVKAKRITKVESPIEARYWVVTIDYRLLKYDAYRKQLNDDVPICLHPTSLIQMLQFWIPRTSDFEEAILNSLRLPFLFQAFDKKDEDVTAKLLTTISSFENIENVSVKTLTNILVNQALRQKIAATKDIDEQRELIKEAFLAENIELDKVIAKFDNESKEKDKVINNLLIQIQDDKSEREELHKRVVELETKNDEELRRENLQKSRLAFAVKWVCYLIALVMVSVFLSYILVINIVAKYSLFSIWLVVLLLPSVAIYLHYFENNSLSHIDISDWKPIQYILRFKKWLFGVIGGGVFVNAIWDLLKQHFDLF